ncbi:hypothetical protein [Flagellimonas lutimaris]|nr:hypothetical protein [Allomuricauda lutimaris]
MSVNLDSPFITEYSIFNEVIDFFKMAYDKIKPEGLNFTDFF